MTFLLRGPTLVWMSDAIRSFSYLGSTKAEFPRAPLRIYSIRDVRITGTAVLPICEPPRLDSGRLLFVREHPGNAPEKPHLSVEAEAFALTVTDRDLDRTDANFKTRAPEVAENLCLLILFPLQGRCDLVRADPLV
jgi:hypothetical protein